LTASTLHWVGFYVGVRSLPGDKGTKRLWIIGSVVSDFGSK
jgi:hypothetical protein